MRRYEHAARIMGYTRFEGQLYLQPRLGQIMAMTWISRLRRLACAQFNYQPEDVFPREDMKVFKYARDCMHGDVSNLVREVWEDQEGCVVLPTDPGGADRSQALPKPTKKKLLRLAEVRRGAGGKSSGKRHKGEPLPRFWITYRLVGLPWDQPRADDPAGLHCHEYLRTD